MAISKEEMTTCKEGTLLIPTEGFSYFLSFGEDYHKTLIGVDFTIDTNSVLMYIGEHRERQQAYIDEYDEPMNMFETYHYYRFMWKERLIWVADTWLETTFEFLPI